MLHIICERKNVGLVLCGDKTRSENCINIKFYALNIQWILSFSPGKTCIILIWIVDIQINILYPLHILKFLSQLLKLFIIERNYILWFHPGCHRWRYNAQKMRFPIKDFFSKCDQILRKLQIWSHLLKKFLMDFFVQW